MNTGEKEHIEYIKAKGKFTVACRHDIFSKEEIKLLEKYGHWFEALAKGVLPPLNDKHRQFIEVAQMKRKWENFYEKAWFKYVKRKELESEKGAVLFATPQLEDDTFYSRDMVGTLKRTLFKVMKENHKK